MPGCPPVAAGRMTVPPHTPGPPAMSAQPGRIFLPTGALASSGGPWPAPLLLSLWRAASRRRPPPAARNAPPNPEWQLRSIETGSSAQSRMAVPPNPEWQLRSIEPGSSAQSRMAAPPNSARRCPPSPGGGLPGGRGNGPAGIAFRRGRCTKAKRDNMNKINYNLRSISTNIFIY